MNTINHKKFIIIYILFIKILYVLSKNDQNINIKIRNKIKYCFYCQKYRNASKDYCKKCPATKILNSLKILTPDETLDEIITKNKSIARYGDVELELIWNMNRENFQTTNKNIRDRLLDILNSNEENLLIGLWNSFSKNYRKLYIKSAKRYWDWWLGKYKYKVITTVDINKIYASTAMSRFYFDYKDRSHVSEYVKKLKMIWDNKDIVMIEGEKTRLGLGNDLFNNANSIQRILCPNSNAFDVYDKILNEALKIDKNKLIITALGPTATILAYDLYKAGYQIIDIGHVDIEYEWYLRNSTSMVKIENKIVVQAEGGTNNINDVVQDEDYNKQIIARISN